MRLSQLSDDDLMRLLEAARGDPSSASGSGGGTIESLSRFVEQLLARPEPAARQAAGSRLASPTDQARDDLVEHRAVLAEYGRTIESFLAAVRPRSETAPVAAPAQTSIALDDVEDASAVFTVVNDERAVEDVTFAVPDHASCRVAPERFVLGPREARTVVLRACGRPQSTVVQVRFGSRVAALVVVIVGGALPNDAADAPTLALEHPGDDLDDVLRAGQAAILRHPLAAQAIFRAFVAEGRRFGATAEGERWRTKLGDSELVRRGRVVWEVLSHKLLEEDSPTVLPSKLLEAFVRAAEARGLERRLGDILGLGADGGDSDFSTSG